MSRQQAARDEVLRAVRARQRAAPPAEQAEELGDDNVTTEEALAKLGRLKPGSAPGPDRVPGDLCRIFRKEFAPLFARIFTAVAATQRVPRG